MWTSLGSVAGLEVILKRRAPYHETPPSLVLIGYPMGSQTGYVHEHLQIQIHLRVMPEIRDRFPENICTHVPTRWGHVEKSGTDSLNIFCTHVPTSWRRVKTYYTLGRGWAYFLTCFIHILSFSLICESIQDHNIIKYLIFGCFWWPEWWQ